MTKKNEVVEMLRSDVYRKYWTEKCQKCNKNKRFSSLWNCAGNDSICSDCWFKASEKKAEQEVVINVI